MRVLEALTSTAVNKGGLSVGDIALKYKLNTATFDVIFDTASNVSTTVTVLDIVPSTKTIAVFKLPGYTSGKLEVQYFHEHAAFSTAVGLNPSPLIDASATIGTQNFAFGAEAGFDTAGGNFTKYSAGLSVTKPDSCFSITVADKGDLLKAAYVHSMISDKRTSGVVEFSRRFSSNQNTVTVGTAYAVDALTLVKTRLNNHGHLGALIQHELKPKSLLTVSGEFNTKALEKTPKFGLALSLQP